MQGNKGAINVERPPVEPNTLGFSFAAFARADGLLGRGRHSKRPVRSWLEEIGALLRAGASLPTMAEIQNNMALLLLQVVGPEAAEEFCDSQIEWALSRSPHLAVQPYLNLARIDRIARRRFDESRLNRLRIGIGTASVRIEGVECPADPSFLAAAYLSEVAQACIAGLCSKGLFVREEAQIDDAMGLSRVSCAERRYLVALSSGDRSLAHEAALIADMVVGGHAEIVRKLYGTAAAFAFDCNATPILNLAKALCRMLDPIDSSSGAIDHRTLRLVSAASALATAAQVSDGRELAGRQLDLARRLDDVQYVVYAMSDAGGSCTELMAVGMASGYRSLRCCPRFDGAADLSPTVSRLSADVRQHAETMTF